MYEEDIPRYKKKAKKKSATKANHKHYFEPCVFKMDETRLDEARGFVTDRAARLCIGTYCPACGKVGDTYADKWYINLGKSWPPDPTDEAKRQLDEKTRTLPCFYLGGWFTKYISLEEREDQS